MSSVTLTMTPQEILALEKKLQAYLLHPVPYSVFRAKYKGVTLTAYQSGKVLFQGKQAEAVAKSLTGDLTITSSKSNQTNNQSLDQSLAKLALIGSDEVGNGSYFGALTVCAVYLHPRDFDKVQQLGVKDSKALTDQQIMSISPQLAQIVTHKLIICYPRDYNRLIGKYNAVSLKVRLHNQVHQAVLDQLSQVDKSQLQGILIDQFTSPTNYNKYLQHEANACTEKLIFRQKAEGLHLAVASASILARAAFLKSLEELGQAYQTSLPSGAGSQVDDFGRRLVKVFGPQVLQETAKLHFKNTEKILKQE